MYELRLEIDTFNGKMPTDGKSVSKVSLDWAPLITERNTETLSLVVAPGVECAGAMSTDPERNDAQLVIRRGERMIAMAKTLLRIDIGEFPIEVVGIVGPCSLTAGANLRRCGLR